MISIPFGQPSARRTQVTIVVIILLFYWVINQGIYMRRLEPAFVELPASRDQAVNPNLYKVFSGGHLPLIVDALLLRFLVEDPSTLHVNKGAHPPGYYDLMSATDLDPAFFDLYNVGANYLAIVRNDGEGARALLLKGDKFRKEELPAYPKEFREKYWRQEWLIPMLLAYVYLFELNNMAEAAGYFIEASTVAGSPPYLKRLASRLVQEGGPYHVGLELLKNLADQSKDSDSQALLRDKWMRLRLQYRIFVLQTKFDQFLKKRRAGSTHSLWAKFLSSLSSEELTPDPIGGSFVLGADGKIRSEHRFEKVLGLE